MPTEPTASFRLVPLDADQFAALHALDDAQLAARGMQRRVAEVSPGYPCRVSLADAEPGERVLLLHYLHHAVDGPYRASGPIFVRERAVAARPGPGEIPEAIRRRPLSLRAYDAHGCMHAAEVCDGADAARTIERLFADRRIAYLHLHNARPGCYACRVERVDGEAR